MIFLDLINLNQIRRAVLYVFVAAAALWLQFAVLSRFGFPGAGAAGVKPFFIPALAVAIGLWEGGAWGGVFGLGLGIYCDMNLTGSTVTFLLLCAVYGFFSGVLADFVINRRFVAYMLLTAAALLAAAAVQALPLWIFRGASPLALLPVALWQALWSLPFAVPCYFACRAVARSGGGEG